MSFLLKDIDRLITFKHNVSMNRLSLKERAKIIGLLAEGNSMRATSRLSDVSLNTVTKLLVDVGTACAEYQDKTLRNLTSTRVQCDEIWSFCHSKEKNVPKEQKGTLGFGDVYTWTAICADTKLCLSYLVGRRDASFAQIFIQDLASRLKHRIQLTTDGYHAYVDAVEDAFRGEIDYAMLVKIYGEVSSKTTTERKYSSSECCGTKKEALSGSPDKNHISTSYVERQNLTMRMSMRRFTRLTNAFSKKIENLECAVALHFMYYNFGRIHKSLRVAPAMQAGIADHVWSLEEIAELAN